MSDADPVRDLIGPVADLPAPPSPDDRGEEGEETGGFVPGTGRRAEDHQPQLPDGDAGS